MEERLEYATREERLTLQKELKIIQVELSKLNVSSNDIIVFRHSENYTEEDIRRVYRVIQEMQMSLGIRFGFLSIPFPNEISVVHIEDKDSDSLFIKVTGIEVSEVSE